MIQDLKPVVEAAYRVFLGRDVESRDVLDEYCSRGSIDWILSTVIGSAEAAANLKLEQSPFYNYSSMFDAQALIRKAAVENVEPEQGVLRNFMGVRIEERYLPALLAGKAGTVEGLPIPANWHADIAEWGAVLRAVDLATDSFTMAELGCGWGCWLNNAGVAARNHGLAVNLIGVEGDKAHLDFAWRCAALNSFSSDDFRLVHGIAAARSGIALFPIQGDVGADWGRGPVFGASENERAEAVASGGYDELPMISLDQVIGDHPVLDLLHIDIQGGEADLIENTLDILSERVAYMFVGTHSRVIEGRIMQTLDSSPWRLDIERPAIVSLGATGPMIRCDGAYGWRNMSLRPD